MVASTKDTEMHIREINGLLRAVRQTRTARVYSRPITELDWLLMDPPEHDSHDDLRDLGQRLGR
jgi:hypothetical protein